MKKVNLIFLPLLLLSLHKLEAQTTAIPDSNFEKTLIDLGIDSDSSVNGKVLTSDINSITDLNVTSRNIASLAGIENFDSLKTLNCSENRLTSIDISKNLKLTELSCASNKLTTLDVSSNSALEKLNCQDNLLVNLDVSANTLLENLDFTSNQIAGIILDKNDSLLSLKCTNNRLRALSVQENTLLEELNCSNNQIKSLNLEKNIFLRIVLLASNQLTHLDITNNDSLNFVDVSNNQLKTLDVSNNLLLTNLTCSKNQLSMLDVAANDSLTSLAISNNGLQSINLNKNKKLEYLTCASNQLKTLNLSENLYLVSLDASKNLVHTIDLAANNSLTSINVSSNQLTSLNIKNGFNSKINGFDATNNHELHCIQVDDPSAIGAGWQKDDMASYNEMCNAFTYVPDDHFEQALIDLGYDGGVLDNYVPTAAIDTIQALNISGKNIEVLTGIEAFVALTLLDCSHNVLHNLDVSGLAALGSLNCSDNSLVDLNLKNIQGNLTGLNATANPLLTCIGVDDVAAANRATGWVKDAAASYNLDCSANKTYVPDDHFEQALIDLGYDKGSPDNYVVTDSIKNIRILNVSNRSISDLTGIEAFTSLDSLDCSSNSLTSLSISTLKSLKKLACFSNYLSSIDITLNDSLLELNCGDNRITELNVAKNIALLVLVCDANDLTALDVSKNTGLQILNCGSNYLGNTGLDISRNIGLLRLICPNNKFTAIDISKNVLLADLDCSGNYLTALDLTRNSALLRLSCSLNELSMLDVTNNINLVDIECNTNQIATLDFSANKKLLNLSCDDNQLNNLNIANNDSLKSLSVAINQLMSLDVSKNVRLNLLKCDNNLLPVLNLTNNDSITYLSLANNKIPILPINNLSALTFLNCDRNGIASLNLSSNNGLLQLYCSGNSIQNLDLGSNKNIQVLDISKNKFTELLLTGQDSLKDANCSGNQLKSLALDNNRVLQSLNCANNELERLTIRNGNNDSLLSFNSTNNPGLTCIEIDDQNRIGEAWQKDSTASYSLNCHYDETYVPDDNFEAALAIITGVTNDNDDYILTASIDTLTSLDVSNKNIIDLKGLQDLASLKSLNISHNSIDSLDVSSNTSLLQLNASENRLDTLDLSNNRLLQVLNISHNQIKSIRTDSLASLREFNGGYNSLAELDFRNNTALISLTCDSNHLTALRINNGNNNNLAAFNATNNPGLTCIEVDDPNAVPSGWQKDNIASYSKNCHYNEIFVPDDAFEQALIDAGYDYPGTDSLDNYVWNGKIKTASALNLRDKGVTDLTGLEAFTALTTLNINNNDISTLDISYNLQLERLYCSANLLTKLEINKNNLLAVLDCSDNLLDTVDFSENTLLRELNVKKNPITHIALQNNTALAILDCSYTNVVNLNLDKNTQLTELAAIHNEELFSVDIQSGNNGQLQKLNLQFNPNLTCILVDDKDAANGNANWLKDDAAAYRLICDDDDNDGVPDNDDQCPATRPGDTVDLFGCSIFMLPADNFSVLVTGEVCRSSNNGMINVTAVSTQNYTATIEVDGINRTYKFTNKVEIRGLRAGTYQLCITIENEPTYAVCYEITIIQPIDLAVIPRVSARNEEVTLELSGGTNYTVELNGVVSKTSASFVSLHLRKGMNNIRVKTDAECQGIYEKSIFIADGLAYYPNPFDDHFTIFMGNDDSRVVYISIYSASGKWVLSGWQPVRNGAVHIEAPNLAAGFYTVSVQSGATQYHFKMLKK